MSTRHRQLATFCCLITFLSHLGCERRTSSETGPRVAQESPEKCLIEYFETPDEAHYQQIVKVARLSINPSFIVIWNYDEASKRMRPVDDQNIDQEAVNGILRKCSSDDFVLLAKIMLKHPDPWRRWTMAVVIGKFAGKSAIPYLDELLNDSEPSVQQYAKEAIQNIRNRHS